MGCTFVSLLELGLAPAADVFTRGFAGYFVPVAASPAVLAGFARTDSVDLAASRIVLENGSAVGGALIARRGRACRLAGMALVPEARGRGVGREFMARLMEEARARGERTMELEVIEQNEPAVRLYRGCGFATLRRLTGHAGRPAWEHAVQEGLEEIDPRELAATIARHGWPDLPWQVSAETVAQATPPAVAYRLGASSALLTDPAAATIVVRALITEDGQRGRGGSLALLRALLARHPGREWRAPALFPAEMGPAFLGAGLEPTAISQFQMRRALG